MTPREHRHLMHRIDTLAKENRALCRENKKLKETQEKYETMAKKLMEALK